MDDRFCDQSKAYGADFTAGSDAQAVTVYEQFKEVIEQVDRTLADDEKLLVIWYDPAGDPVALEHMGYYGQTLLVLRGRDSQGVECTALAPAVSMQLVLKKVKKLSDTSGPFNFMGHSVLPESPPRP
mgnify:CR=1 FL=1